MPDMQLGVEKIRAALERELGGYKAAVENDNAGDDAKAKYQKRAAGVEAELAKLDDTGDVEEAGGGSARGRSGRRG